MRAVAAIANGGKLLSPSILKGGENKPSIDINLNPDYLKIVKEGMRDAVIKDYGVVKGLNSEQYAVGAKTGTAEIGIKKLTVNNWIEGFFPYDNPKYAFALIMEKGPSTNNIGSVYVMRQVFDWMAVNRAEYLK